MDFEPAITQLSNKVAEVAALYGPTVQDTAYAVIRINIVSELVSAFIVIIGFGVPYFLAGKWFYKTTKNPQSASWMFDKKGQDYSLNESSMPVVMSLLVSSLVYFFIFITNISTLLNVWLWVGLSNPALYIAKEAWDAVVK